MKIQEKMKFKIPWVKILQGLGILLVCLFIGIFPYSHYQLQNSDKFYRNADNQEFIISESSSILYLKGTNEYLEDIGYHQDGVPDIKYIYHSPSNPVNSPGHHSKHRPSSEEIKLFQKEKKLAEAFYASLEK